MKKLIWQPLITTKYDFAVFLDRDYAHQLITSKIPEDSQKRMNELANDNLISLGINWKNPYTFHDDSCLVSQMYIGNNGVWLATTIGSIEGLLRGEEKTLEYHSHNVDTSRESHALLMLFDLWIRYADVLME